MTTTILVRHQCDHCREAVEVEHEKDKPTMPATWQMISVGGNTALLCDKCVQALSAWIATKEPVMH